MNNTAKSFIWIFVVMIVISLFNMFATGVQHNGYSKLAFSDFLKKIDQGAVSDVVIHNTAGSRGSVIDGHLKDGTLFYTAAPEYPQLIDKLSAKDVKITAGDQTDSFTAVLLSWFPILLLIGVYLHFMRKMRRP